MEYVETNLEESNVEHVSLEKIKGKWVQEEKPTDYQMQVSDVRQQVNLVQHLLKEVMKEGQHYGIIQGCGNKPTLLKAGAEKLGFIFKLAPSFQVTQKDFDNVHREYQVLCTLTHIETGKLVAQGVGSCSTMESKYRYRKNWQTKERIENPDIADQYNTVLKMAKKRAFVDATITATAASDIFTQDIEDMEIEPKPTVKKEVVKEEEPDTRMLEIYKELRALVTAGKKTNDDILNTIREVNGSVVSFLRLPLDKGQEVLAKIKGE